MFGLLAAATDSLLCRVPVVVSKRAAKTLTALHVALAAANLVSTIDDRVFEALMIAFAMVMSEEGSDGATQRALTEKDQSREALRFDAQVKSFKMRVQVRTL